VIVQEASGAAELSRSSHRSPTYRADIDGLRAVAVVLVVLCHFQFARFAGGFVGVDVFFVISGYLIGGPMIAEMQAHRFSLKAFYERRVRRIVPALLAMLSVVSLLAYRYLMPKAMLRYAQSVLAALVPVSNILFWQQGSGYFGPGNDVKPLLHTWSLAVEEQFYLLLPLLLFALVRRGERWLRAMLLALAAISFAGMMIEMRFDSTAAFFLTPLRAWELLAGVLTTQYALPLLGRRWVREGTALVGVALIFYAGTRYTVTTAFPGWAATLPCLGAVLLLAAGRAGASVVGRVLGTPPFTFVGAISYSLYLWHWPLMVFQNVGMLVSGQPLSDRRVKWSLLGLSLIAAILSWALVERPFRWGRFRPDARTLWLATGVAAGSIACAALAMLYLDGMPQRLSPAQRQMSVYEDYDFWAAWRAGNCFVVPDKPFSQMDPATCLGTVAGKKNYLLYGDSTAAQLYPGLVAAFPEVHFLQATAPSCPPLDTEPQPLAFVANCKALRKYLYTAYLTKHQPDVVILSGGIYSPLNFPELEREIARFRAMGTQVVVVGPMLTTDLPMPLLIAAAETRNASSASVEANVASHFFPYRRVLDAETKQMAHDRWHVPYISFYDDLCTTQSDLGGPTLERMPGGCPLKTAAGEPLLFDDHHFSLSASKLLAQMVRARGELLP
jgi:peptidoglycan/LPS O-acetylase OafA/YrhL